MERSASVLYFPVSYSNNESTMKYSRLQRTQSLGNCTIEKKRGFKPSDRYDPVKKDFLINLSKRIWHKVNECCYKLLLYPRMLFCEVKKYI